MPPTLGPGKCDIFIGSAYNSPIYWETRWKKREPIDLLLLEIPVMLESVQMRSFNWMKITSLHHQFLLWSIKMISRNQFVVLLHIETIIGAKRPNRFGWLFGFGSFAITFNLFGFVFDCFSFCCFYISFTFVSAHNVQWLLEK